MKRTVLAAALLVATGGCEPAMDRIKAMHGAGPHAAAQEDQHAAQPGTQTVDLQGGYDEWRKSPYIQQFYELTMASFASGADKVDFPAYQEKSYAIFRAFGGASGGAQGEVAMLDHLKDIPRQMVGIVKEAPEVLESSDKFWVALAGPP